MQTQTNESGIQSNDFFSDLQEAIGIEKEIKKISSEENDPNSFDAFIEKISYRMSMVVKYSRKAREYFEENKEHMILPMVRTTKNFADSIGNEFMVQHIKYPKKERYDHLAQSDEICRSFKTRLDLVDRSEH